MICIYLHVCSFSKMQCSGGESTSRELLFSVRWMDGSVGRCTAGVMAPLTLPPLFPLFCFPFFRPPRSQRADLKRSPRNVNTARNPLCLTGRWSGLLGREYLKLLTKDLILFGERFIPNAGNIHTAAKSNYISTSSHLALRRVEGGREGAGNGGRGWVARPRPSVR